MHDLSSTAMIYPVLAVNMKKLLSYSSTKIGDHGIVIAVPMTGTG